MAQRSRRTDRPAGRKGINPRRESDRDPRPRSQRGIHHGKAPHRGPGEGDRTFFDGFAEVATRLVSSAYFFAFCVASVVAWALFGPGFGYSDTWQLVINTATTILTFLMVAVLQNSSRRGERALQAKLDAIADALADFMDKADIELTQDVRELEEAVGLEKRVSSK
jgi:low affinity Fe/Cu permease